jgi:hypothetical protein
MFLEPHILNISEKCPKRPQNISCSTFGTCLSDDNLNSGRNFEHTPGINTDVLFASDRSFHRIFRNIETSRTLSDAYDAVPAPTAPIPSIFISISDPAKRGHVFDFLYLSFS